MYSEKSRHIAMDIACNNHNVAFLAKIKLVKESGYDLQNGFLMYLPSHRNGAVIENIAPRRKELIDYVYSPFRMDSLIKGIEFPGQNWTLHFRSTYVFEHIIKNN
jgi:CHASE1-domain containing sensor protein